MTPSISFQGRYCYFQSMQKKTEYQGNLSKVVLLISGRIKIHTQVCLATQPVFTLLCQSPLCAAPLIYLWLLNLDPMLVGCLRSYVHTPTSDYFFKSYHHPSLHYSSRSPGNYYHPSHHHHRRHQLKHCHQQNHHSHHNPPKPTSLSLISL